MISILKYFAVSLGVYFLLIYLSGCSLLEGKYEKPEVHLVSIKILSAEELTQTFRVGFRVMNPNSVALPLEGMSVKMSLNGYDLLSGSTNQLSSVGAFSDKVFFVDLSVSLFKAAAFLTKLAQSDNLNVNYQFTSKIHTGGFLPTVAVSDGGSIAIK